MNHITSIDIHLNSFKICFNVFYIKIVLTVKFNRYSSQFKSISVLIRFAPENSFKCLFIQFFLLFFHTLKIKRNCLETRRAEGPETRMYDKWQHFCGFGKVIFHDRNDF